MNVIGNLFDRRIDRVDRDQADGGVFGTVLVRGNVTLAGVDGQFHEQVRAIVEVTDHVVFVQNFDTSRFRDLTGGHNRRAFGRDRNALGTFGFHADGNTFEVQNHIGHVFTNASDAGELVQNVVDLNRSDRRALQRAHQNAAQGVAQRQTKATLQRLGDDRCLTCRVITGFYVQLGRLDKFLPVLMDHACLLNSCLLPMSKVANARGKKTDSGRAKTHGPIGSEIRRDDAWAGGSRCARSGSHHGSR